MDHSSISPTVRYVRCGIQDGACWTFVSLACEQQASPWGYGDSHRPHRTAGSGINASGLKICRLPNQTTRSWRKKVGNPLDSLRCSEVDDLFGLGIGSSFGQFEEQAKSAIFAVPLRSLCRTATGGLGTPSRYRTRSISSPWCEIAARKPGLVSVNLCKAMIHSWWVLDFGVILCNHIYNHIQYQNYIELSYRISGRWYHHDEPHQLRAMPAGCSGTWCLDERPVSLVRLTQNKKEGRIHFSSCWNIQWKPIRHLVCWILQSASNLRHL